MSSVGNSIRSSIVCCAGSSIGSIIKSRIGSIFESCS